MKTNQLVEKLHDWQKAFIQENCENFKCIPLCEGKTEGCIVLQAADRIQLLDKALNSALADLHGQCQACLHYSSSKDSPACRDCCYAPTHNANGEYNDNWKWVYANILESCK